MNSIQRLQQMFDSFNSTPKILLFIQEFYGKIGASYFFFHARTNANTFTSNGLTVRSNFNEWNKTIMFLLFEFFVRNWADFVEPKFLCVYLRHSIRPYLTCLCTSQFIYGGNQFSILNSKNSTQKRNNSLWWLEHTVGDRRTLWKRYFSSLNQMFHETQRNSLPLLHIEKHAV